MSPGVAFQTRGSASAISAFLEEHVGCKYWGAMGWWDWTGVGERRWKTAPNEQVQPSKTLWDLLQLLIVPVILIGVSLWWSASQDSRDKRRADQVRQDTTLNDYIQQMSDLMLTRRLLSSNPSIAVRSVARTATLTTLHRLDGGRKGEVVRFLHEARLIAGKRDYPVELDGADLTGADLTSAFLPGAKFAGANLASANLTNANLANANLASANLAGADLRDADLTGAELFGADLRDADLTGAVLFGAGLSGANIKGADLRDADLTRAILINANLTDADLRGADLTRAILVDANLTDADLRDANLTDANFKRANLKGAKLNGARGL